MINHEELLKKYIELVEGCEGYDFISDACEECGFSDEEIAELRRLSKPEPVIDDSVCDPKFVKEQAIAMNEQAKVWVGACGSIYQLPDGCNNTGGHFKSYVDK